MRLSPFFLGNPRRIITNALLTAIISVPTASCFKTDSKQSSGSIGKGNAATDNSKNTNAGTTTTGSDPKPDDKKPVTTTKAAPASVTWDGIAPRGTPKYAVVATE